MSVDQLPSGMWRTRLQIDGRRRHVATFQTRQPPFTAQRYLFLILGCLDQARTA